MGRWHEQLPAQIAETGSIAVDGVSTATITSDAIKEAARAALTRRRPES
ncbi:MAG: FMN-binding protein [Faecalibacterium prausnitzii]